MYDVRSMKEGLMDGGIVEKRDLIAGDDKPEVPVKFAVDVQPIIDLRSVFNYKIYQVPVLA